ncbi:hypothetical protein FRC19_001472 [Serendipita sp. 401]|nr:hypothetical protein FRC19_001472 [Serendipita sp. 401]
MITLWLPVVANIIVHALEMIKMCSAASLNINAVSFFLYSHLYITTKMLVAHVVSIRRPALEPCLDFGFQLIYSSSWSDSTLIHEYCQDIRIYGRTSPVATQESPRALIHPGLEHSRLLNEKPFRCNLSTNLSISHLLSASSC